MIDTIAQGDYRLETQRAQTVRALTVLVRRRGAHQPPGGGLAAAAAFLERSAELTTDPVRQVGRDLAARVSAGQAGYLDNELRLDLVIEPPLCRRRPPQRGRRSSGGPRPVPARGDLIAVLGQHPQIGSTPPKMSPAVLATATIRLRCVVVGKVGQT